MVICKEKAIKKKKASSTCLNVNRVRFTFDTILIKFGEKGWNFLNSVYKSYAKMSSQMTMHLT